MITRNFFNRMTLHSSVFATLIIAILMSCDGLESDPDASQTNVRLLKDRVDVLANNTTILDVSSLIQTSMPVRVTVSTTPGKGKVKDLGDDLLEYFPDGTSGGNDALNLAVYNNDGTLIKVEQVEIDIKPDTTDIPCSIYPVDDLVLLIDKKTVTINVLANDFICGTDSASLNLSIWQPTGEKLPMHGTAIVVDNQIVYTPDNSFTDTDKIVYKISSEDGSKISFGTVLIQKNTCGDIHLTDDHYVFYPDSTNAPDSSSTAIYFLHVFDNDSVCNYMFNSYSIYNAPNYGDATIDNNGITYEFFGKDSTQVLYDTLGYQVCLDTACYRAEVLIELKP